MTEFDAINEGFWASFLQFALGDEAFRVAFTNETGWAFPQPRNGLAAMIDEATGHGAAVTEQFMVWATMRHWGFAYAPVKFQRHIRQMAQAGELTWLRDGELSTDKKPAVGGGGGRE